MYCGYSSISARVRVYATLMHTQNWKRGIWILKHTSSNFWRCSCCCWIDLVLLIKNWKAYIFVGPLESCNMTCESHLYTYTDSDSFTMGNLLLPIHLPVALDGESSTSCSKPVVIRGGTSCYKGQMPTILPHPIDCRITVYGPPLTFDIYNNSHYEHFNSKTWKSPRTFWKYTDYSP